MFLSVCLFIFVYLFIFYIAVTFSSNSFVIVSPDNVGGSSWSSVTRGVKRQEVVNPHPPRSEEKKKEADRGAKVRGADGADGRNTSRSALHQIKCHPRQGQLPEPPGGEGKGKEANEGEEICGRGDEGLKSTDSGGVHG